MMFSCVAGTIVSLFHVSKELLKMMMLKKSCKKKQDFSCRRSLKNEVNSGSGQRVKGPYTLCQFSKNFYTVSAKQEKDFLFCIYSVAPKMVIAKWYLCIGCIINSEWRKTYYTSKRLKFFPSTKRHTIVD